MNSPALTFVSPEIEVTRGVYRPSADSKLLAQAFVDAQLTPRAEVLDLCCGSGFQGISAAILGHHVDAVDAEHCAVINARRNALLNGVQVRVLHGNLFEPVRARRYDAILANPPYVPTPPAADARQHRWSDGGDDGRELIDQICAQASSFLNPGGSLWMVHSSLADLGKSAALLSDTGLGVIEVSEQLERFGPVTAERLEYLRDRGLIEPEATHERLAVLSATRQS